MSEPTTGVTVEWVAEAPIERQARKAIRALQDISWQVQTLEERFYGDEGGFSASDMVEALATIRKALIRGMPHPMNAQYQRQALKLRKGVAPAGETSRFLEGLDSLEELGPLKEEDIPF